MKTAEQVAAGIVYDAGLVTRENGVTAIAAALESFAAARVLAALQDGLGDPPVSDAVLDRAVRSLLSDIPMSAELADVELVVDCLSHYRALAAAISLETGAASEYKRGKRAGLAEGKRRAIELIGGCGRGGWRGWSPDEVYRLVIGVIAEISVIP